jgi:hypothetical protein
LNEEGEADRPASLPTTAQQQRLDAQQKMFERQQQEIERLKSLCVSVRRFISRGSTRRK